MTNHCLVFDPIPFAGGSKIATLNMLAHTDPERVKFTVITASPSCWRIDTPHQIDVVSLASPRWLAKAQSGALFWLKQLYFSLCISVIMMLKPKVQLTVGASGPGVDMALYLCRFVFGFKVAQLIHGPVARSRSIGFALTKADFVFYLTSSHQSLLQSLQSYLGADQDLSAVRKLMGERWIAFDNGLPEHQWPSQIHQTEPVVYWAASLLKWKGLDLLVEALSSLEVESQICFIRPKNSQLAVSKAPVRLNGAKWYQQPNNLDDIRKQSSIFVSTSVNEPFGLSILEALAAGMCVIVPKDGSYWDQVLTEGFNCIKYEKNDARSLQAAIQHVQQDPELIARLGRKAKLIAAHYTAKRCYQTITHCIHTAGDFIPTAMSIRHQGAAHE
ncbi:glycosyltransferase family 4 protein [Vibrio sp. SCSIO 43136]|uniref:glycosyltransferase family 4 protein n=1 Tax=Vibrio sp. SCSIO 43136 TaxID=2819101 RepID=UPI002074B0F6|nr:glycosyltransferase family 4 protein [Vibrio sp. SCSIO 43136]USD67795.1 glycosyltransferase family 4 protein [Vibrio sp. SCSIO 43136]